MPSAFTIRGTKRTERFEPFVDIWKRKKMRDEAAKLKAEQLQQQAKNPVIINEEHKPAHLQHEESVKPVLHHETKPVHLCVVKLEEQPKTMIVKRKEREAYPEMIRKRCRLGEATEEERDVEPGSMTVELMKHQKRALAWMLASESKMTRGGLLADDQGLGKTISTIALILTAGARQNPKPHLQTEEPKPTMIVKREVKVEPELMIIDPPAEKKPALKPVQQEPELMIIEPAAEAMKQEPRREEEQKLPAGGTLIVCPLSVVRQWEREIHSKVSRAYRPSTLVYHGEARKLSPKKLASYDVVITTYGMVTIDVPYHASHVSENDYGPDKTRKSALKRMLKKTSELPLGPLAKVAWHRVVLDEAQTIRNAYTRISIACRDLEARYRWGLSGTPLQNSYNDLYAYFRFLQVPPHNTRSGFVAVDEFVLKPAFQSILLRRTKGTLVDGKPLLQLPPRIVNRVTVRFTALEASIYEEVREDFAKRIQEYVKAGLLNRMRLMVLCMLGRLRRMCDDPVLLSGKNLFPDLEPSFDEVEDGDPDDPQRRRKIQEVIREFEETQRNRIRGFSERVAKIGRSSKVKAAMEVLDATPAGEKTLFFSQWTSMLDVIEPELERKGIRFTRVDGTMNTSAREKAIRVFSEDPNVTVMLLSLKAAGCGLNLIAASRVVLLDMWWNPTTEDRPLIELTG